jgi:hypothetical protein
MYRWLLLVPVVVLIMAGLGCGSGGSDGGYDPAPRGDRVLGLDVSQAETTDYSAALTIAVDAGVQEVDLSLDWKETQEDTAYSVVDIADLYYPATPVSVTLILRPINTNSTTLPTGVTEPFDQAATINAFNAFVDAIHTRVPQLRAAGKITAIMVGNEIDIYLGTDSVKWAAYEDFFIAVRTHILGLNWGGTVTVSPIGTFSGITDPAKDAFLQSIFAAGDRVPVTYYPMEPDFLFRDPSTVFGDFQAVVDLYPGRTIEFVECGYASDTVCGGSEARQAAFVRNVFKAWDTYRDVIAKVDFTWETDVAEATADQWVIDYGMSASPYAARFKDYLWTLGLRTYPGSGTDKPAFTALKEEAAARGW